MFNHDAQYRDWDYEAERAELMAALGTPDTCGACGDPCDGPHCPDCAACIARDAAREVTFWAAFTVVRDAIARINAGAAVAYTRAPVEATSRGVWA
jgi:hypothetical protein